MPENLIQTALKRIRPGSGGPAEAVSIIDGAERAPIFRPKGPRVEDDEDFDDARSGMPLARSLAASAVPTPSGLLPGVDPDDPNRRIPFHEPDDPAVLNRLFNLRIRTE
jgi:hypothetical protein